MKRRQAEDSPDERPYNPHMSPCHNGRMLCSAPVYLVDEHGTETQIGHTRFCPDRAYKYGRPTDCHKLADVRMSIKKWPPSLTAEGFRAIADKKGPGFWMSPGFHVTFSEGAWVNFRDLDYVPVLEPTPAAKRILAYREKTGPKAWGSKQNTVDEIRCSVGRDGKQAASGELAEKSTEPFSFY